MKDYRKLYKKHYDIEFGPEYVIHHIDENRDNNEIENLILLPSSLHSRFHEAIRECRYAETGSTITLGDMRATLDSVIEIDYFASFYERMSSLMREIAVWVDMKRMADMYINQGSREFGYKMFREEYKWLYSA